MPLLSEVFALVDCYRADRVRIGIDPKFAADAPRENAPRGRIVRVVARAVRAARMLDRVTIPELRLACPDADAPARAAAADRRGLGRAFLDAGEPGASPWLGGIDVDDYDGDLVAAAASFGADGISPGHGSTTRRLVRRAHRAGMTVLPWTVDDPATMRSMIDAGVDGIVTDYPDRLRAVMAQRGLGLPEPARAEGRSCLGQR